jgi:hypothetical protein
MYGKLNTDRQSHDADLLTVALLLRFEFCYNSSRRENCNCVSSVLSLFVRIVDSDNYVLGSITLIDTVRFGM